MEYVLFLLFSLYRHCKSK